LGIRDGGLKAVCNGVHSLFLVGVVSMNAWEFSICEKRPTSLTIAIKVKDPNFVKPLNSCIAVKGYFNLN
jgi:hypothetical protein